MESIAAILFAATEPTAPSTWTSLTQIAIICVALIGPFILGAAIANAIRMREYGWKIGLILCGISVSCAILWNIWDPVTKRFNFKLGVDLQGGVILIYEVEQSVKFKDDLSSNNARNNNARADSEVADFSMSALIEALSRRINPAGTKEIVIRPYGERQVEIIIPEVDQREVEHIKKVISTAGVLQFRIVANSRDHRDVIDLAREAAQDPIKKRGRVIFDDSGSEVGLWARVGRESKEFGGVRPFKVAVGDNTVRDAMTGDLLEVPNDVVNNVADVTDDARRLRLARWAADRGIKEIDVLMETNDGLNVNGAHLGGVSRSVDELMKPCIHFSLKDVGVNLFGELTGRYSPEGQFHRQLGIVLDNELLSAPNIQERITERGRITGQFTDEEVQFLVNILQAGSLPVVLNKTPISSSLISPLLGEETIQQGKWAMILSMVLVFLFMMAYYRFSGFLACIVLSLNLLFTLALIVLIKAPLTLPGLAGLVLTVGMAVDSNVLIYERFREEQARGAALRMVIRNGFSRATTTIIDSNLTTVLTALVLYAIGTDQLRGFAVTLTLGLITSMFTAIFCSRVLFDIAERKRIISELKMFRFLGVTKIDFIGFRHMAVAASLVVLLIGVAATVVRGSDVLDIDFTGGSSVHLMVDERAEADEVRKLLDPKFAAISVPYTLTGMSMTPGDTMNTMFKVDAKIENVEDLEKIIQDAFRDSGGPLKLATYSLNYDGLREVEVKTPTPEKPSATSAPSAGTANQAGPEVENQKTEPAAPDKKADVTPPAETKAAPSEPAPPSEPAATSEPAAAKKDESQPPTEASKTPAVPEEKKDSTEPTGDADKADEKKENSEPPAKDGASSRLPGDEVLALALQEPKAEEKNTDAAAKETKSEPASAEPAKGSEDVKDAANAPQDPAPAASEDVRKDNSANDANKKDADKKDTDKTDAEPAPASEPKVDAPAAPATTPATPADVPAAQPTPSAAAPATVTPPRAATTTTLIEATLQFGHGINAQTLRAEIEDARQQLNIPLSYFVVENPAWDGVGTNAFDTWTVRLSTTKENAQRLLDHLKTKFTDQPVWPSSNHIGPTVAGRLQRTAIMALVASWLGIIIYVWVRFQNFVFGVAAVIALVHDVLVTVAALAVSHWLVGPLGFLLVEDFKINLTIVAALLTIIGYSINDTIVIFDRIREVRGKSPDITAQMVNLSVNQTLSRTLLTFFYTFIVVVVLYAFGGQGIHGFAFAMVIGMLTGTYSTVFIATPFVLWLAGKSIDKPAAKVTETVAR